MSADRGAYIDQSQSLNIHLSSPTMAQLTSMHFYGWRKGLKTGMYYLRTRAAVGAIKFTVDQATLEAAKGHKRAATQAPQAKSIVAPQPLKSSTSGMRDITNSMAKSSISSAPTVSATATTSLRTPLSLAKKYAGAVEKDSPAVPSSTTSSPALSPTSPTSGTSTPPPSSFATGAAAAAPFAAALPSVESHSRETSATGASTAATSADEEGEITFEEAQRRREQREYEEAKLMCSLENKEACLMCSG